jgi:hypothetical protein
VNSALQSWITQVTTGHGFMILVPTLVAAISGTLPWSSAVPLLTAALVGLIWPENPSAKQTAQSAAIDIEALIAACRPSPTKTTTAPPTTGSVPNVPARNTTAALIGALLLGTMSLAACTNQTAAQQAAGLQAVASGLVCVADAAGKVTATASTSDPNSVKAVNAAVAAGGTLITDIACQTAISEGVAALEPPAPAASAPPASSNP